MKYLITSILLLFLTIPSFGQSRVLEQVDENQYVYKAFNDDGSIHQKGMYIEDSNGELVMHSIWKDDVGTKALYDKGELVWIKPKNQPRYTKEQIEYEQLKSEIKRLKAIVALRD